MRKLSIIAILMLGLSMMSQAQEEDALAMEVIARLNEWRISEDVWPLKPNDTLAALALSQAHYLASLPTLPDDLHIDKSGLQPRERALLMPYNWPHYELPGQIAIGENAAIGSVDYAFEFWTESAIHARTALNPDYREVGVGVVPYKNSNLFIVVFGARPDVLPALVDPQDGRTIYLSNEDFEYARFYDSIQTASEIQVFDSSGRPIYDEPLAWTEKLAVPVDAGDSVFILSSDGNHEVLSAVDLSDDHVILPDSIEPEPTALPPTQAPAAEQTAVAATPAPTMMPTMTPVPVITEEPPSSVAQPDLLIMYSNNTLDVINVSAEPLDLRTLEIDGVIDFPFTQFTRVTDFPLEALPTRHCLQIRSQGVSGDVVKQDTCNWVRSLITVSPDRIFWAQAPFEVQRNGLTIATCQPNASVCAVDLP